METLNPDLKTLGFDVILKISLNLKDFFENLPIFQMLKMNFLLLGAVGAIQSQKCESLLHLLSFCSVYSLFSLIHSFLSFILSFIFGFFLKLANQMQQFHQSSSTPCVIPSSTPSFPCVLFPSFLLSLFLSHFFIYPLRLLNSNICK